MHLDLNAEFDAFIIPITKLYLVADTFELSYKYHEDATVEIKTRLLKIALLGFSVEAPVWLNHKFNGGVSLEPYLRKIPIICLLNLSQFSLVPRNEYAILSYTPVFEH